MSDGFYPSPGAVRELTRSIVGLGFTIAGKLDDAEKASEYNNGLEFLRKGLSQFDLELQQNPDWRKYPELALKRENDLWQQVDQMTKHQGAKNDLQTTWQEMRARHFDAVGTISNQVRVKQYHAGLVERINGREKDVEAGTLTAAEADAANEADLKSAADTGVIDPTAAFTTRSQLRAYMQTAEAGRKIRELARDQGWDAAIAAIPQIAGQYSELKSPGEIDAFTTTMERQRDYAETRQKKEDDKVNGDTDLKLADMWSDFLIGEKNITLDQMKAAIDNGDFRRQEGAQLKRSWLSNLETYIRQGGRAAIQKSDTTVMGKLVAMGFELKGTDPLSRQNYMNLVNAAKGVKGYERYATPEIRFGSITWEDQAKLLQMTTETTDPNISVAAASLQKDLKDIPDAGAQAVIALDEWRKKYKADNKGRDPTGQEIQDAKKQIKSWVMEPVLAEALSHFDYKSKGHAAFILGQDSPYQNLAKAMTAAQNGELEDVAPSDSRARATIARLQTMAIEDFDVNIYSRYPKRGVSVNPLKSRMNKAIPIIATTDGLYWRPYFDQKQARIMWQFATQPDDPKNWQEYH